jgi:hypothetical protein
MTPIRLNDLAKSAAIYTTFADAIQSSTAVIADITKLNMNVDAAAKAPALRQSVAATACLRQCPEPRYSGCGA